MHGGPALNLEGCLGSSEAGPQTTDAGVSLRSAASAPARRDPRLRERYLTTAYAQIPRLLTLIDRNPFHRTYGCFDRGFWHYRTGDFPSGMYQEGVLPLALVWAHALPGNRWYGHPRIKELALAGIRFAVRSAHRDGSCDDYYPYERTLGAVVFSLYASAEAYRLLGEHDLEILAGLERRARWLRSHDEAGRLANHQAWAALGLYGVYRLTGRPCYLAAAECRLRTVLRWQSNEGWFQEYEGCDPGYLTVTIDALAKYWQSSGDPVVRESLSRAIRFARHFLHPDGSYGGHYGSRGTCHFYPHGMEIMASEEPAAAEIAEGFLHSLANGRTGAFDDDRLFCHRLPNLLQAYQDWGPGERGRGQGAGGRGQRRDAAHVSELAAHGNRETYAEAVGQYFPEAGLYVHRSEGFYAVVACAKGASFKLFLRNRSSVSDTGPVLEMEDGRVCVAHLAAIGDRRSAGGTQDSGLSTRYSTFRTSVTVEAERLQVSGTMHWVRHETATPLKQVLFRAGVWFLGRRRPGLVRRLLQRRLITGRKTAPVLFCRTITWGPPIEVVDHVQLTDSRLEVLRLAIGTDQHEIYTAAGNVYQEGELGPWWDLSEHVAQLNQRREITIRRVWE